MEIGDYECCYFYQLNGNEFYFWITYKRYDDKLNSILGKIYYKFYNLPIPISQFAFLKYDIVHKCLLIFSSVFEKKFSNFLFQYFYWATLNYIKKFYLNRSCILNLGNIKEDNIVNFADPTHNESVIELNIKKDYLKLILQNTYHYLSVIEKTILLLKLKEYSTSDIAIKINLTNKQIENAYYRAIFIS